MVNLIVLDKSESLWRVKRIYPTLADYERETGDYRLREFGIKRLNQKIYLADSLEQRAQNFPLTHDVVKKVLKPGDVEKIYQDRINLANSIIKRGKKFKYFSHETRHAHLPSIFRYGLQPKYQHFRGLNTRLTFYTGFKEGLHKSSGGVGQPDSAYIIFTRPDDARHVLRFLEENFGERGAFAAAGKYELRKMEDWFVSQIVIPPDKFLAVLDNREKMIWER